MLLERAIAEAFGSGKKDILHGSVFEFLIDNSNTRPLTCNKDGHIINVDDKSFVSTGIGNIVLSENESYLVASIAESDQEHFTLHIVSIAHSTINYLLLNTHAGRELCASEDRNVEIAQICRDLENMIQGQSPPQPQPKTQSQPHSEQRQQPETRTQNPRQPKAGPVAKSQPNDHKRCEHTRFVGWRWLCFFIGLVLLVIAIIVIIRRRPPTPVPPQIVSLQPHVQTPPLQQQVLYEEPWLSV